MLSINSLDQLSFSYHIFYLWRAKAQLLGIFPKRKIWLIQIRMRIAWTSQSKSLQIFVLNSYQSNAKIRILTKAPNMTGLDIGVRLVLWMPTLKIHKYSSSNKKEEDLSRQFKNTLVKGLLTRTNNEFSLDWETGLTGWTCSFPLRPVHMYYVIFFVTRSAFELNDVPK